MSRVLQVTLGILTAMGGFVDISELVFSTQAGAHFNFLLLWTVIIGLIGIIVYGEMCGRIATVAKRPVFDLIRERLGFTTGFLVLIASLLVNIITCIAEVGGVAIALQLLTGFSYTTMIIFAALALIVIIWVLKFEWLERFFGLLGLLLLIYLFAVFPLHPQWGEVAKGFIPTIPHFRLSDTFLYLYFMVGIISSTMMPYEVYFYSSGGIEEGWKPKDLINNYSNTYFGFTLGAVLDIALIIIGGLLFASEGIVPDLHTTVALAVALPFGKIGLIIGLLGIVFVVGGAAVETGMAGAYSVAQFFGWEWGRYKKELGAPRFTLAWVIIFLLAGVILLTGINPVTFVEYGVIFSVVALPLTYLPILLVANDKHYMGKYTNGIVKKSLGWIYFGIVSILAIMAIPLMILTNMGQG